MNVDIFAVAMRMWLPVVCAALLEVALCKELTLSVWSYSPYPGWGDEPMGTPPMWSVDDWITVDAQGKATPWVTTILATPATGANQTVRVSHPSLCICCIMHVPHVRTRACGSVYM